MRKPSSCCGQIVDLGVEFDQFCLDRDTPIVVVLPVHQITDLGEREPGSPTQRYHGESFDHSIVVLSAKALAALRLNEANFFIVPERSCRQTGPPTYLTNVHEFRL